MSSFDRLNGYLRQLEQRLRWSAVGRGAALLSVAALLVTVLLVLIVNSFAFSPGSLLWARMALFVAVALALAFGIVLPLLRLNRHFAAKRAESKFPEFEQRLVTVAERMEKDGASDPFVQLLAADTVRIAEQAVPERVAGKAWAVGGLSAAAAGIGGLLWLILAGPGFLGHGASLLWGGTPKSGAASFYSIVVQPGDQKVRRGSDQLISASLIGFHARGARLYARYEGTSKWEEVQMEPQPGSSAFEFLFAGLSQTVEYYVEAGSVRSEKHTLTVVDLPAVRKIRVTYNFPKWTGLKNVVEDPGGDLRAVEGTEAEVEIETDKELPKGVLVIDGETRIPLERKQDSWVVGRIKIEKSGMYHIAAIEGDETVRISEDFFIEARPESGPSVKIRRPGRDARVLPVEEVTIEVEAEDDFGLEEVTLKYSVNGGEEKSVPLLKGRGAKESFGEAVIALEDYKLSPGDVVSFYAIARDARTTSRTDMYFIEAQPYEREVTQSQQMGGGAGGGMSAPERISDRQKEIIAATFNQLRNGARKNQGAEEDAKFLADVQGKLRDQAKSLAQRMRSRELSRENQEFQQFSKSMEAAAEAMGEAVEQLRGIRWKDALPPEQRALQHLLRAEATFRQIQVAFGARGGGGGGGGAGRDLESLFDLELDTEKNQYETGQSVQSASQQAREVDEALKRLEELARRQQQLSSAQNRPQQSFQQRWQQEMLRREAEELRRRMEQLARGDTQGQQSGQQGQSGQQSGQSGQQAQGRPDTQRRLGAMSGRGAIDPRVEKAIERLRQATEDMRRATQPDGANTAEGRRAAERLQEARELLSGLRQQEAKDRVEDLKQRAESLANQQRDFEQRLRQTYGGQRGQGMTLGQTRRDVEKLAAEKQQMLQELQRLERDLQSAAREMQGSQREAAAKLRDALSELQENELPLRMKFGAEWIRRGYAAAILDRETPVTQGLERVAEQVRQAQGAMGNQSGKSGQTESALERVERLRNQLQQMADASRRGQERGQGQQSGQGQQGQQQGREGAQGQQSGHGQQGSPGQQPGQDANGQGGINWNGGGRAGGGSYAAMNTGDRQYNGLIRAPRAATAEEVERAWREGMRELSGLRQSLADNPEAAEDVQDLIRQMQRLDPKRFPGNPELVQRLISQILPSLEQLELQLRRQAENGQSGQVRSGLVDRVPTGYADAVAEYFRRLSKGQN